MLVLNFTFDLLWKGKGSSTTSVTFQDSLRSTALAKDELAVMSGLLQPAEQTK